MNDDTYRRRLDQLIKESGEGYATISALLGRNAAYIQQYIKRGIPRQLYENDRRTLADRFNVPEWELGKPPTLLVDQGGRGLSETGHTGIGFIPCYDITASAGAGRLVLDEEPVNFLPFRSDWLTQMASGGSADLAVLSVQGDSMYPTLDDGDQILLDRQQIDIGREGIFVIRLDTTLHVKRLSLNPASAKLVVKSDNPLYETWTDLDPAQVQVIGRVIWVGRRLK